MCGELDLSFVCSRHRGTVQDWRTWTTDEPKTPAEEAYERLSDYNDRVVLPALEARG
jgi:hypothetical protein